MQTAGIMAALRGGSQARGACGPLWLVVAPGFPALVAAALARDAQDFLCLADEEAHDAASAAVRVHREAADRSAYLHALLVDEHRKAGDRLFSALRRGMIHFVRRRRRK